MGIADRDWYRDELKTRSRWTHPLSGAAKAKDGLREGSLLAATWVIVLAAVIGLSIAVRDWRQGHAAVPSTRSPLDLTPAAASPRNDSLSAVPPVAEADAYAPPDVTREVTKCIVNGRAAYAAGGACQGGVQVIVPISGGPSSEDVRDAQAHAEALSERAAEVDRAASLEEWRLRTQLDSAPPPANLAKTSECATLDQAIRGYDAQARQPQAAGTQDWLKDQRARVRSQQFALHC